VAFPGAIFLPDWSVNSTPENFEITPSLKLSLISVGALAPAASAGGLVEMSVGWAMADVAIRFPAKRAIAAIEVIFCIGLPLRKGYARPTHGGDVVHSVPRSPEPPPGIVVVPRSRMVLMELLVQIS